MSSSIANSYNPREELFLYGESRRAKRPLTIHVEDADDKIFWIKIFESYSNRLDLNFVSQHVRLKPDKNAESCGKSIIMKMIDDAQINLSENEIACVDADYDLIINDTFSKRMKNQYIVNTKWYAIENIICHPHNLENLFVELSEKKETPDYAEWIKYESLKYAQLFLLHLSSRRLRKKNEYPVASLAKDITSIIDGDLTVQEVLEQHDNYISDYQYDINTLEEELHDLGYQREDYYKIMQGHTLLKQIVTPYMKETISGDTELVETELQRLETNIESFFRRGYTVENLDVTQEIRERITAVLGLK